MACGGRDRGLGHLKAVAMQTFRMSFVGGEWKLQSISRG